MPTCSLLEYARDFGNNMKESLKRATEWSAYYFTHANSYYPVPETKVALRDIPKIKRLPVRDMSKQDKDYMRQWASEHGKAVRQLSVRQNNTDLLATESPKNPVQLMILVTSCQRIMILTPATKKTVPPTKKTRSRLFL